MLINTNIPIYDPKPNQIVFYGPDSNEKPYPVLILSGQFMKKGRVDNRWSWHRLYYDGNMMENGEGGGYGEFYLAEGVEGIIKPDRIVSDRNFF